MDHKAERVSEFEFQQTHEVTNQPPPLENVNLFESDTVLKEAVAREGAAASFRDHLAAYGVLCGSELIQLGFDANRYLPELHTHDRYGHRIDEVTYHPAYHRLMAAAIHNNVHALPWQKDANAGAQIARAAMFYMHHQVESGTCCPVSIGFAAIPLIRREAELASVWEGNSLASEYDPRNIPAPDKKGVITGVAMTEKQGGSDVQVNSTRAFPIGKRGPGHAYSVVGHKWFCSAPMCDAFFILAHTDRGLSCFHLPRWRPEGTKNAFEIQRLKDKLGNRSNASAEVEFRGAYAVLVGEEGRGVRTIFDMVSRNRLDCLIGSAGLMRQAVAQAIHHCTHRAAFGKRLVEHPLMQNVLADLAIESEAATVLAFRAARALDRAPFDEHEHALLRILVTIGKFWVCKRATSHINEAQECLGGAGYVEDSILPRLFRDAPLNSIWEGSGNIQCLDIVRALAREERAIEAFVAELEAVRGPDARLDAEIERVKNALKDPESQEYRARHVVELMATTLQAALLVRAGNQAVAETFACSRLGVVGGRIYGVLPVGTPVDSIVERASPTPFNEARVPAEL